MWENLRDYNSANILAREKINVIPIVSHGESALWCRLLGSMYIIEPASRVGMSEPGYRSSYIVRVGFSTSRHVFGGCHKYQQDK
jgi:hypothetical protein